ncbi:MAG: GTPase ObgE [Phycisphaerae bacterium]|nr:GTPase ObgE [Phycisphaerae bacterium]
MFVDEVDIAVIAGGGGNGCVAFRREKFVPRGGPNGGDGGDGGSVFLAAEESLNSLHHLVARHHWRAERGQHGMGKERHGRGGRDLYVPVPPGTIVHDADYGIVLKDLARAGDSVCVAAGGKGGRGNTHFKTAVNQAPRECEPGQPGQQRSLHLELKLIADAGLLGLPNAGKSTLLSRLSQARPKIAPYPFTTLTPWPGIVELSGFRRFLLADMPGLIEGAHAGSGLGHAFLRHVERTRVLVHMVDICPSDGEPAENYRAIRNELRQYSQALAERPELVVANKMDLTGSEASLRRFQDAVATEVIPISAVTGRGLNVLAERIWQMLQEDQPRAD